MSAGTGQLSEYALHRYRQGRGGPFEFGWLGQPTEEPPRDIRGPRIRIRCHETGIRWARTTLTRRRASQLAAYDAPWDCEYRDGRGPIRGWLARWMARCRAPSFVRFSRPNINPQARICPGAGGVGWRPDKTLEEACGPPGAAGLSAQVYLNRINQIYEFSTA